MLERFYPDKYVKSAYDLPYEKLYEQGYRGIIYDIDNTLVPHNAPADERAKELFARLHKIGFSCCLLSNNKRKRVADFNEDIGAHMVWMAAKPAKGGYRKAMEEMGTDPDSTLFIGDQLFTDVWGARRVGIYSILVKPIHPKEEIQIVLKRYLERIVLHFYHKELKRRRSTE